LIELVNIHFSYNNREVLRDISLKINDGEVFGIPGPNGAGKSTLIMHLNGILKPKAGKIIVNGIEVNKKPKEAKKA